MPQSALGVGVHVRQSIGGEEDLVGEIVIEEICQKRRSRLRSFL